MHGSVLRLAGMNGFGRVFVLILGSWGVLLVVWLVETRCRRGDIRVAEVRM